MAPSGLDAFQRHSDVISARRSGGEFQRIDYFRLNDGESARVRFLEQGENLTWATSHRIKTPGLTFPQDVLCLDQEDDGTPCPACMSDNREVKSRSTKGYLNIIWRGTEESDLSRAPIYKRNDKGSPEKSPNGQKIVTGFEDSTWLWKCSKTVFEQILAKDKAYKGLMSRDFLVSRKGAGLENTTYFIEPAIVDGGPEPLTVADQNLAQGKLDVVSVTTPGSFSEMQALIAGLPVPGKEGPQPTFSRGGEPNAEDVFSGTPMRSSAFQK
jgi:hypothetical protein